MIKGSQMSQEATMSRGVDSGLESEPRELRLQYAVVTLISAVQSDAVKIFKPNGHQTQRSRIRWVPNGHPTIC